MKRHLRFLITFLLGAVVVLGVCASKNVFQMTEPSRILRTLCDGFFLAGVLISGMGLLVMISKNGIFDVLTYASGSLLRLFIPGLGTPRRRESFADYRQKKHAKPGTYGFLVIIGGLFLLAACICLMLYGRMPAS